MTTTTDKTAGADAVPVDPNLVTLTIDGIETSVPKGTLIIRAAEEIGIAIPRFCDHPLLKPVGACRQCLVDVAMPDRKAYRAGASLLHWYADTRSGCRSLQEFKKISILEVKGYCYGWHFYQAGDADLVISSDDALFGHPAFRYVGYAPRMWQWATMMGLRKFQEMVFTGRPFTADEMAECGFVNSVVPRDQLEDEVQKYALACAQNRPTDVIFIQHGKIALDSPMDGLGERYLQLIPAAGNVDAARALKPFYEREVFGRVAMLFDGRGEAELAALGETRTPSVADLFVAMMTPAGAPAAASKEAA